MFLLAFAPTYAVWDDTDYAYRMPINTSGATITDYQLGFNFTKPANMEQNDFDDMRFYSSGSVELSYWIENKSNGNWAYVWLKGNFTTANSTDNYVYYGNATATSLSNTSIFAQYHGSATADYLDSFDIDPTNPLIVTTKIKMTSASFQVRWGLGRVADTSFDQFLIMTRTSDNKRYLFTRDTSQLNLNEVPAYTQDVYAISNIKFDGTTVKGYVDGDEIGTGGLSTQLPNENVGLIVFTSIGTFEQEYSFVRKYSTTEPTYSIGAEESQDTNRPPTITINNPGNTTYYTTSIPLNITVSDSDSASFWCAIYNDGVLVTNETTNTTYTTTLTKTGGSHNVSVTCEDVETKTSTDAEYYYVFMGLNVSVFNNETNASMTDWDIFITNGTVNYTNTTLNNSALFEWDTLPTGSTNITISDGSSSLYFYNSTYERNLNNSALLQLNAYILEKDYNPITLTSSLGWTLLEGQTTTINCSAPQGTPDFNINSVIVSSPYIFTTSSGTYTTRCDVDVETTDYAPTNKSNTLIANPLISCSTNTTFAFSKTITTTTNLTTLDFTTLVSQNLVRDNLGDVYVPGIISTWVNTTNAYNVIVNNTGNTSFVVYFGNLFVNNTYSTHAVSGDVDAMGAYTQINPYVQYNVLNELTGVAFFPPNATLTSIIHCNSGETYIPIDDNTTRFIIASTDYVDKASLRISYTADAYYSRQFYPSSADVTVLNFYVMDAFVHPLDRIDFVMLNMDHYTELLQIYKEIQSEAVIITEGYFDISHSFSAYLLEDVDYLLRTRDSNNIYTEFGRITIVAPAIKELGQITLDLNPQATLIAESIFMNAYTNDVRDTLSVVYSDATNQTEELNITVFFENGTIFQTVAYDDTNSVNINYNISTYSNQTFTVDFELNHTTFGNSPVSYSMGVFAPVVMNLGISALGYQLISLLSLVLIGGIVTRKNIVAGSVVLFMMVIIFKAINWLVIPTIGVVFIGVLMVLGIINYIKQGGE